MKQVLDLIGLGGYPKTTGGDGMHVYVPVEPIYTYEETRTFADLISRLTIQEDPSLFTTPRTVAKRQKNRVYFDYLQNGRSKTIAAPYVRAPIAAHRWRLRSSGRRCAAGCIPCSSILRMRSIASRSAATFSPGCSMLPRSWTPRC